jgi:DNA ligase-4
MDNILESLLRTTSVGEQKWIIRILLKHIKFGLGRTCVFKTIHPDAEKLFDVCNNLQNVSADRILHSSNYVVFTFATYQK